MKLHAVTAIAMLFLVAAVPASACHFSTFNGGADCSGYFGSGNIYIVQELESVILHYELVLTQGATTVETVTGSVEVFRSAPDFNVTGMWKEELCGDYAVAGHFWFTSDYDNDSRTFEVTFTCECDHEGGCHFTPGYWKNHPEAWPVMTLTLGGISYNQAQLLAILNMSVRQDPTIILAHHLIAAKLNVANGADDSINGAIGNADALLVTYPLYSNPKGSAKQMIIAAKDVLCAYNETIMPGCEGYIMPTLDRALQSAPNLGEKSTWGDIKGIYR